MQHKHSGNPLHIGYFFHPKYQQFREQLFREGANYIGHELMVPEPGDYRVLETMNDEYILLRLDNGECVLRSNICRHQQARLIDPKNRPDKDQREGNMKSRNATGRTVCPVHGWVYKPSGELYLAPHFETQPKACLPTVKLKSWNGMLFRTDRDIASDMSRLGHSGYFDPKLLDMKGYIFMRGSSCRPAVRAEYRTAHRTRQRPHRPGIPCRCRSDRDRP